MEQWRVAKLFWMKFQVLVGGPPRAFDMMRLLAVNTRECKCATKRVFNIISCSFFHRIPIYYYCKVFCLEMLFISAILTVVIVYILTADETIVHILGILFHCHFTYQQDLFCREFNNIPLDFF